MTKCYDKNSIAVTCSSDALKPQAQGLADKLELNFVESINTSGYLFLLNFTPEHLELISKQTENSGVIYIDFLSGKTRHRLLYGGGRHQLLARATGLHKKKNLTICDISAGLGQDAFQLAGLGAQVTMVERSPVIAAILYDAWLRAQRDENICQFHWKLIQSDAKNFLNSLEVDQYPQVLYYDPMFPERKKSALVKKEMRIMRQLVGEDEDAPEILSLALAIAKNRVVVKRPRLACSLPGPQPSFQLSGQSSRFDIYLKG